MPDVQGLRVGLRQATPIRLDADLTCAQGEVLALVGPSGSGKSSILRAIAGLLHPREGQISCNGETWLDTSRGIRLPPQKRRVGMMFQEYALFPHLSAVENIMEALLDYPAPKRRLKALELLERVHLAGLENRKPAALSGGQQQRVAVARALAREPHALLLDEPFSAVDRATRERLYRELAELRQDLRMPVILVTHDLTEASMLADRLCLLSQGSTLQTGAPLEVMSRPHSLHVARLLGLKNLFHGRVLEHRTGDGITLIEWGPYRIEARHHPQFSAGELIDWVIPQGSVLLHRRDRPSRGERENPVNGTISEFVPLGQDAAVTVRVDAIPDKPLFMSIPLHVAARNGIAKHQAVTVSLLADSVHLMRNEPDGETDGHVGKCND